MARHLFPQFIENITGRNEGFPESELITLFGFFKSSTGKAKSAVSATRKPYYRTRCRRDGRHGAAKRIEAFTPPEEAIDGGRGSETADQGADWTAAVASLRLLVKPKEPVLSTVLEVFEIFSRARGSRTHHRKLQHESLEEKQRGVAKEEEYCKRRKRWGQIQRVMNRVSFFGFGSRVGRLRLHDTSCYPICSRKGPFTMPQMGFVERTCRRRTSLRLS